MEKPLISIAMTTYNGEKFLREQLDSIYQQTYQNFEVNVCDDGSTDNTLEILKEYHVKYGLNYWVNERNLGFIKNFEKVLSLCKGELIALADQDDIWNSEKLEILEREIEPCSMICSDAVLIHSSGAVFNDSLRKYQKIYVPDISLQFKTLFFRNFVTGCTVLFKKNILKIAFPFPERVPHDWWLAITAMIFNKIKYISQPLVLYRQHENNTLGARKPSFIENIKNSKAYLIEQLNIAKNMVKLIESNPFSLEDQEKKFFDKIKRFLKNIRSFNLISVFFLIKNLKQIYPERSIFFYFLYITGFLLLNKKKIKD